MSKNYKINIAGVETLDEETLGMLIDCLVDLYSAKFGLGITLEEPERPRYDTEDLGVAKDYLKKYRLPQ